MIDTERLIASVSEAIRKEVSRHKESDNLYCVRLGETYVGDFSGYNAREQAFRMAVGIAPTGNTITVCIREHGCWRVIGRINT